MVVAYTPTASRGTSTPSDTIRTATIQRSSLPLKSSMRWDAPASSDSTRVALLPVISRISLAYARAESWSEAMTRRAGVRDGLPDLGQPLVGGAQHVRHPLAARVQRGTPGLADRVLGHRLAEPGGDLVARLGPPAHVAAVGEEDDGPDDAVGERVAVAVGVVGGGPPDAVVALLVRHEGDGVGVGPEGRTGEREPPGRGLERLQARLAPGLGVTGVVDLVEDDEGLALLASGCGAAWAVRRHRRR